MNLEVREYIKAADFDQPTIRWIGEMLPKDDDGRQRIGIDHRLLFRLLSDRVEVVHLIPRQDLERKVKILAAQYA